MFAAGLVQVAIGLFAGVFGTDRLGGIFTTILAMLWLISGALFKAANRD